MKIYINDKGEIVCSDNELNPAFFVLLSKYSIAKEVSTFVVEASLTSPEVRGLIREIETATPEEKTLKRKLLAASLATDWVATIPEAMTRFMEALQDIPAYAQRAMEDNFKEYVVYVVYYTILVNEHFINDIAGTRVTFCDVDDDESK